MLRLELAASCALLLLAACGAPLEGAGDACVPATCGSLGFDCGPTTDGCGRLLDCGGCARGTCGGGGRPNVCGAQCRTPCPTGSQCTQYGTCSGASPTGLVLNEEPAISVAGSLTVAGQPPTKSAAYCGLGSNLNDSIAVVQYVEPDKGYSGSFTITCSTPDFAWALPLPAGTYDFRVARGTYATQAGVNLLPVSYLAAKAVVVSGPITNLVLNEEPAISVAGSLTVAGQLPTKSAAYCGLGSNLNDSIAVVQYVEAQKGYSGSVTITCSTPDFAWALPLPAGTYDFRVSRGTYATQAGVNLLPVSYLAAKAVVVSGPVTNLVLNEEPPISVAGSVAVAGQLPTKSAAYCGLGSNLNDSIAVVQYVEAQKGYSGSFTITCSTPDFAWALPLPAGTYDFRVSRGTYATQAGVNLLPVSYLAAKAVVVSGPVTNLVLNEEPPISVAGSLTVAGQLPTKSAAYCGLGSNLNDSIAVVQYVEAQKGYSGSFTITCSSPDFAWTLPLPAGTYDFRVGRGTYATQAGVNLLPVTYLAAKGVVVSGPVTNLVLNEAPAVSVAGSLTVAGQLPTKSAAYCGLGSNLNDSIAVVQYVEPDQGYSGSVTITCSSPDFAWALPLPAGTYDFRVGRGTYATQAGVNLLPVTYLALAGIEIR